MKRSDPYKRGTSEQRDIGYRNADTYVRHPSNVSKVFTERPHYGIPEPGEIVR